MPQISLRACEMPESPIRKLFPLAEAAKARGVKVYHLNIGQPDLPTPQVGLDALKQVDRTVLEYSPSDGYRSLREKLVEYYAQYQIRLTADDIIVTTGGSEAVLFAFMSCLNPGDEIIVPEPAYANYMAFAVSAGAVIRPITASIEDGFALPSVEKFEELINDRTRGILICNPNNPTGYLYTRREMMQIRDLVKRYDLFLFSDEVYREFIYTGSPYISACHLEGIEQNVVLIDSVSKRYSECGIRIGALITKNRALHDAVMRRSGLSDSPFLSCGCRPSRHHTALCQIGSGYQNLPALLAPDGWPVPPVCGTAAYDLHMLHRYLCGTAAYGSVLLLYRAHCPLRRSSIAIPLLS